MKKDEKKFWIHLESKFSRTNRPNNKISKIIPKNRQILVDISMLLYQYLIFHLPELKNNKLFYTTLHHELL